MCAPAEFSDRGAIAGRAERVGVTCQRRNWRSHCHRGETIQRVVAVAGVDAVKIAIAFEIPHLVVGVSGNAAIQRC